MKVMCCVSREDGDNIECYTVASHGRIQPQRWIHHYHTELGDCTRTLLPRYDDVVHSDSDIAVMIQLVRDIVFRQVDSVPQCVCQPPQPCLKFVVDDCPVYPADSQSHWHAYDRRTAHNDHPVPPLLPPKPTHLSAGGSRRSQRKDADSGRQSQDTTATNRDRVIDRPGCVIDRSSRVIDTGCVIDRPGRVIGRPGCVIDRPGHVIDRLGRVIDTGCVIDRLGCVIDRPGRVIDRHRCQVSPVTTDQSRSSATDELDVHGSCGVTASNEPYKSLKFEENSKKTKTLTDDSDADGLVNNEDMMTMSADGTTMSADRTTMSADGTTMSPDSTPMSADRTTMSAERTVMTDETVSELSAGDASVSSSSSCNDDVVTSDSLSQTADNHDSLPALIDECLSADQRLMDYTDTVTPADSRTGQRQSNDASPAAAADLERLYSFVRKKSDRCQSFGLRCRTGSETDVKPIVADGETATETQTARDGETELSSSDVSLDELTDDTSHKSDIAVPSLKVPSSGLEANADSGSSESRRRQDVHELTNWTSSGQVGQQTVTVTSSQLTALQRPSDCRLLTKGSLLLSRLSSSAIMSHSKPATNAGELESFMATLLTYDEEGSAFYVPAVDVKLHGDPAGEPWFYPVPLTSLQATILLSTSQTDGCFLVYRELARDDSVEFSLSVCAGVDVLHYVVVRNVHGDLSLAGHAHSFVSLSDLVSYFQHNASGLATRLGRPLSVAHLPVTPGVDYDVSYELARSQLTVTGNIIANGRFGVICAGKYRGHAVAIKVLSERGLCHVCCVVCMSVSDVESDTSISVS